MKYYIEFPVRIDNERAQGIPRPLILSIPIKDSINESDAIERIEKALTALVNS